MGSQVDVAAAITFLANIVRVPERPIRSLSNSAVTLRLRN
jgi:hypothetical protein